MKKFLFLIFAFAFTEQAWALGGIGKMVSMMPNLEYDVNPKVLEMRDGYVDVYMMVTFPPKFFIKSAEVELTPVLKYNGIEKTFASTTVQGEAVQGNSQICTFANGGSYRTQSKIRFEERMRCSELFLRVKIRERGKEQICPDIKIGYGVSAPFGPYTQAADFFAGTKWILMKTYVKDNLPEKAKQKTIKYPDGYSLECYMFGDEVVDNQPLIITDNTTGEIIFDGCVTDNHKTFVGEWKRSKNESVCGTFSVTNTNEGTFSLKTKKTTGLTFIVDNIYSYITKFNNNQVVMSFSKPDYASRGNLIVCGVNGKKDNRFEATIDKTTAQQLYQDVRGMFQKGVEGKVFTSDDSYTFNGKVAINAVSEEIEEHEGKRTYSRGQYREIEISKDKSSGSFCVCLSSNGSITDLLLKNSNDIYRSTLFFKNDVFSKIQWWNIEGYIKTAKEAEFSYANGDSFKGSFTYTNGKLTPNNGVYTYKNGDKFIGNVAGKTVGGAFVDGTTTFVGNQNSVSGNWLSKYQLSAPQLSELEKKKNPTEKKKYAEGRKVEETFFSYVDNGNRAYDTKKYDDAERWYTLALNSIPDDMPLQEDFLKNRLRVIKDEIGIMKMEEEKRKLTETIRTESIKKGNDKYVVEYTRMGYRLIGYDDKGRKKFEYENNKKGTINLSTWNMKIPNRGKLVRYSYDFRGVLSSRQYYNESQSYYLEERQRDDGSFLCEGIYENAGEYMDDILIDVGYDSGFWTVQYPIYRNDPKTGEKKQIATLGEKELKEWLLDYLYKLD